MASLVQHARNADATWQALCDKYIALDTKRDVWRAWYQSCAFTMTLFLSLQFLIIANNASIPTANVVFICCSCAMSIYAHAMYRQFAEIVQQQQHHELV